MPRHRPLFLVRDPDTGDDRRSPALGSAGSPGSARVTDAAPETSVPPSVPNYSHYSDEQLLEERERRLRSLAEPALRIELASAGSHGAPVIDEQVDQITEELIRRARLRHPSARGRAG